MIGARVGRVGQLFRAAPTVSSPVTQRQRKTKEKGKRLQTGTHREGDPGIWSQRLLPEEGTHSHPRTRTAGGDRSAEQKTRQDKAE